MQGEAFVSLKSLFKSAVKELRERKITFAVAGGFAADLYRHEPRLTMDVDLVILVDKNAVKTASEIIESLGLRAGIVRRADLAGGPMFAIKRKSTKPCMVVGRRAGSSAGEGVDILLPEIPWTEQAVLRAQDNPVDFGFGSVPALTVEDVIVAKLYALQAADLRAKDLDDLQSIFRAEPVLNMPYIAGQMSRLSLAIPDTAKPFVPDPLRALGRDAARAQKAERNLRI